MTAILALHLISGPLSRIGVLQSVPEEARPIAKSALDTFEALADKETVALVSLRSFRSQVAKAGGDRFPTIEWGSADAYLLDPDLRLRFRIDGIDSVRTEGAIRVIVRFRRSLDRRDSAGLFGAPGQVLTETELLHDTYELKVRGGRWQITGYGRDAKVAVGGKP